MDWGQEVLLSPVGSETPIRFICAPAQHGSGPCALHIFTLADLLSCRTRRVGSTGESLGKLDCSTRAAEWQGYCILCRVTVLGLGSPFDESDLLISDTGYMTETGPCPAFKEVGTKYGPFDLAMLPIWRGGSLAFLSAAGLRVCDLSSLLSSLTLLAADINRTLGWFARVARTRRTFAQRHTGEAQPGYALCNVRGLGYRGDRATA
jgi:hypothetical protein